MVSERALLRMRARAGSFGRLSVGAAPFLHTIALLKMALAAGMWTATGHVGPGVFGVPAYWYWYVIVGSACVHTTCCGAR